MEAINISDPKVIEQETKELVVNLQTEVENIKQIVKNLQTPINKIVHV